MVCQSCEVCQLLWVGCAARTLSFKNGSSESHYCRVNVDHKGAWFGMGHHHVARFSLHTVLVSATTRKPWFWFLTLATRSLRPVDDQITESCQTSHCMKLQLHLGSSGHVLSLAIWHPAAGLMQAQRVAFMEVRVACGRDGQGLDHKTG